MQDLNDKVTGGTLPAAEWNEVPSELQNVIEKTGQTLSSVDLDQLGKGIAVYVAAGDFYVDSGAANAYILGAVGSRQTPPSYVNGMKIRYIPANSNTGASTVNVSALGVKNLRRVDGTALQADDLQAGVPVSFQYDTTSGTFLKNGESLPDATETIKGKAEIATQAETDAGTDDARIVTPKKLRFGFSVSLSQNGYIAFPSWMGGLIFQWGKTLDLYGVRDVSLPISFPTSHLAAYASMAQDITDSVYTDNSNTWGAEPLNVSTIRLYARNRIASSTIRDVDLFWLAIGN